VLLDEVPAPRWSPAARYDGTLLLRETSILPASVRDNVAYGCPVTDDQVWAGLHRVGLAERIRELEDGLSTRLDRSGHPLTPAEGRLLLVARAHVADPRLLVVDGLLDGLDAAERAGLQAHLAGRGTCVVLSSELGAARAMERFVALGGGR
jgi:ABC-type multidrug transport system fused ATPase/permease subunit